MFDDVISNVPGTLDEILFDPVASALVIYSGDFVYRTFSDINCEGDRYVDPTP